MPVVPRKTALPARRSPWLWVVSGGSMAWALVVMTIALRAGGKESAAPPQTPEPPVQLAAASPAPIPAPPLADVQYDDGRDESIPLPLEPLLPRRPLPLAPEEAPPLKIIPMEQPKPELPAKPPVIAEPKRPKRDIDLTVFANCASIGTDILFVKDPPEAFRRAKQEKKLVYMMHLSGNLEDKDFT
jgi:hypothetical protein